MGGAGRTDPKLEGLLRRLDSDDPTARFGAARELSRLGADALPVREAMLATLWRRGGDPTALWGVSVALGRMAVADPGDGTIGHLLASAEESKRLVACIALATAGPPARAAGARHAELVLPLVADPAMAGYSALALAAIAPDAPSTLDALVAAWERGLEHGLEERDGVTRALARCAHLGPSRVLPALLEACTEQSAADDERPRGALGHWEKASRAILELLAAAPSDAVLTACVAEALPRHGDLWPDDVAAACHHRLGLPPPESYDVRVHARWRLTHPDPRSLPNQEWIRDLLEGGDEARARAVHALEEGRPAAHRIRDAFRALEMPSHEAASRLMDRIEAGPDGEELHVLVKLFEAVGEDIEPPERLLAGLRHPHHVMRDACARILRRATRPVPGAGGALVDALAREADSFQGDFGSSPLGPAPLAQAAGSASRSDAAARDGLRAMLRSGDPRRIARACEALGSAPRHDPGLLDDVVPLFQGPEERRRAACVAASAVAPESDRAAELILAEVKARRPLVHEDLVLALSRLRARPDDVLAVLANVLGRQWMGRHHEWAAHGLATLLPVARDPDPAALAACGALEHQLIRGNVLPEMLVLVDALGRAGAAARAAVPTLEWIARKLRHPPPHVASHRLWCDWDGSPRLVKAARRALRRITPS